MADSTDKGKREDDGDAVMETESDPVYDVSFLFPEHPSVQIAETEHTAGQRTHLRKEEKSMKEKSESPVQDLEPQAELLLALKNNSYDKFVELIKQQAADPTFRYTKPKYTDYGTCIEIASRLPDRGRFVKALLEEGVKPNVNRIIPEPIHYAAREGNPDALHVLLQDKKTNINAVDSKGRTALHRAVKYSNKGRDDEYAECITMLLKRRDFDINKPNKNGYTAIHEAANSRKEAVVLFLKYRHYDLDLDTYKARGRSARELIIIKYSELRSLLPASKLLITASDINSRLLLSLQNRELKEFTEILQRVDNDGEARINPNFFYGIPYNATCLEIASRDDDCAEFVQQLLNAGADPNAVNPTTKQIPLHLAAQLGNEKVISVLLEDRRTNINVLNDDGKSVLHIIAESEGNKNQINILKLVFGKRKRTCVGEIAIQVNQTDNQNKMAVEIAVEKGKWKIVEIMLEKAGTYLNLNNNLLAKYPKLFDVIRTKFPALEERIRADEDSSEEESTVDLFQLLYNRKFDEFVSVLQSRSEEESMDIDDGNYTLLQYAIIHGLEDPMKELLNAGANPNKTTVFEKRSPIIIASQRKNHELLRHLLDIVPKGKLEVNAVDAKGNTALHFASKKEDLDCVVNLIRHGANYHVKNIFGKTPLTSDSVSCFLDKSLRTNGKYPEDEDYKLTFDYEFLSASKQYSELSPLQQHDQLIIRDPEAAGEGFIPNTTEMDFLFYISESEEHRKMMNHPIIASFLQMKWFYHKFLSYLALSNCAFVVVLLNAYIILGVGQEKYAYEPTFNIIAQVLLWLYLAVFGTKVIYNLVFSLRNFFLVFTNWINIFLIFCTIALLIVNHIPPALAVATIFLSWFKLVLMANHRTPLSIYFEILKTVSFNYLFFLLSYMSLILAFAFSFYSLLHGVAREQHENISNHNKTNQEDFGFYLTPLLSIQKVFIMMMGEFEAKEFLSQIKDYGLCFWLLSLFVFVMAMVLVNLLTGLAVNDIQKITQNAIELSLASRIRLFYELEKTSFDLGRLFKTRKANKLFKFLINPIIETFKIFPRNSRKMIHIYPNKGPKIIFDDNRECDWKINLNILKDAMQIISNSDNNSNNFNIKQAFQQIKENYDHLLERFCKMEERLGVRLK